MSSEPCYAKQAFASSQSRAHTTLPFPGTNGGVSLGCQHSCLPWQSFVTVRLAQPKTYVLPGYLASPPTPSLGMNGCGVYLPSQSTLCSHFVKQLVSFYKQKGDSVPSLYKVAHLHDLRHEFWLQEQVQNNWYTRVAKIRYEVELICCSCSKMLTRPPCLWE